jgi:hypothetical protein
VATDYDASVEKAAAADGRDDAAMSPEERLKILIGLRGSRHPDAAQQSLARVSRTVELTELSTRKVNEVPVFDVPDDLPMLTTAGMQELLDEE